jgi:hypothetical protein
VDLDGTTVAKGLADGDGGFYIRLPPLEAGGPHQVGVLWAPSLAWLIQDRGLSMGAPYIFLL